MIDFFSRFVEAELIKLAGMVGVMHEADHAYSLWSTLVITSISYRYTTHSMLFIGKVFCKQLGFVKLSARIWIAVF